MPSAPPRSVTPISPRACSFAVSASHRHTSHVVPSAAVTRAATVPNPTGTTPVVVGAARVAAVRRSSARSCWRSRRGRRRRRRPSSPPPAPSSSSPHAPATSSTATAVRDRNDIAVTVGVSVAGAVPRRPVRAAALPRTSSTPCTASTSRRRNGTRPAVRSRSTRWSGGATRASRTTRTCSSSARRQLPPTGRTLRRWCQWHADARLDEVRRQLVAAAVERLELLGRRDALARAPAGAARTRT